MLRFIIRRLLITIPTILVVMTITWGLVRLAPGNFYTTDKNIPPAIEQNIREKYGLDKPWYEQYRRTMWNIVRHFDFGTSLKYEGQSVNAIIARSLPVSATVGILGLPAGAGGGHICRIVGGAPSKLETRLCFDGAGDAGYLNSQTLCWAQYWYWFSPLLFTGCHRRAGTAFPAGM